MNIEDQTMITNTETITTERIITTNLPQEDNILSEMEEAIEAFKKLCQELDISEQLVNLSIKDYTAVKSCFILQGDHKLWLLCALFGLVLSISNTSPLPAIFCNCLTLNQQLVPPSTTPGPIITPVLKTTNPLGNSHLMIEVPLHNRQPNVPFYINATCAVDNTPSNVVGSRINYSSKAATIVNVTPPKQIMDNSASYSLLSRMLRLAKINVNLFFSKFNNWMRMIDLPKHVTQLISTIEISESSTCVLFQKYVHIFGLFFRPPEEYCLIDLKSNKRKTRKRPCDSNELFHFCWMVFVATKELVTVINNISSGFHLLLHSLRFIFISVILDIDAPLTRLLVPSFTENEEALAHLKSSTIEQLDGIFFDVLLSNKINFIKEEAELCYCRIFAPALDFLQHQHQFIFNFSPFKSALEPEHITSNLKYLIEFYRDYRILPFGLDEMEYVKLLYRHKSFMPLVVNNNQLNTMEWSLSESTMNSIAIVDSRNDHSKGAYFTSSTMPSVTSSGDDLSLSLSPNQYSMNLIHSLNNLIYDKQGFNYKTPLEELLTEKIFKVALRKATTLPEAALEAFQRALRDEDPTQYPNIDKCEMSVDFYYKILYDAVLSETSSSSNSEHHKNVMSYISSHEFHKSLLTICFDIFMFTYHYPKSFPWICQVFDIEPFYLTQCIELIFKYEPKTPRPIMKHLTILDEDIVSYYGWLPSSPIYTRLDALVHGNKENTDEGPAPIMSEEYLNSILPYFCNVKIDGVLDYDESLVNTAEPLWGVVDPITTMTTATNSTYGIGGGVNAYHERMNNKVLENYGTEVFYYLRPSSTRKISSTVSIFYQKVYHIILTRLNDFGIKLNLSRGEKALVWKCMEYILVLHTYLMKDHHLDQLLICSIFTVTKVIKRSISFARIINCYESQPQAKTGVITNVPASIINTLLHNSSLSISFNVLLEKDTLEAYLDAPSLRPPTTTLSTNISNRLATNTSPDTATNNTSDNTTNNISNINFSIPFGTSITYIVDDDTKSRMLNLFTDKQLVAMGDVNCNVIQFYNIVFSHVIQRFANEMSQFIDQKKIFAEPYPVFKTDTLVCPTRISQNYSVFVSPMKMNHQPSTPTTHHNSDQPHTPFFNNKCNQQAHNLANNNNNTVRFNLACDKSPLVCREINRFVSKTKRDADFGSYPSSANPVRRRLIIEEDDFKKISKL